MKFVLAYALCLMVSGASADDKTALAGLQSAQSSFVQKTAFAKDEALVEDVLKTLDKALASAVTSEVRFQILNFQSKVLVWKGLHTTTGNPEKIYEEAYKKSDEARNLNNNAYAKYAEGNYQYSVALGRWALQKGPLTVLGRVGEMKSALNAALAGETLAGDLGETYDYYGPDRVYGRLYMELPALAGGDKKKALKHLETAYTNAPEHSLNSVYYAQALNLNNDTTKACKVLSDLLAQDPTKMIPDRAADAKEEFADAEKVYDEICH